MNEYNQAKLDFDEAYSNIDLSTQEGVNLKNKVDGLLLSSQNYSSADPMNNRSSREYATQIYKNATAVINGTYNEAPSATASTKNMFNGYSHQENLNNANTLTYKYLNQNTKKSGSGTLASSPTSNGSYYVFNWSNGLKSSFGLDTDTFLDRYGRFVDNLIKNVNGAISAKNSGKQVRGLTTENANQLEAILQGLVDLKTKSPAMLQNDALKALLKFAEPLGITQDGFESYFSAYLPQLTQGQKNKQARINEGYQFGTTSSGNTALDALMQQNGWTIGSLDGGARKYMFDRDFNLITNPTFSVNDDYTSSGYNQAYGIGSDGLIWTGLNTDIKDQTHPYYQQYQQFIQDANSRNKNYQASDYFWDNLNSQSENELLNLISDKIHGKRWIDVSRYFNGNQSVIAVPKDGKTVETDAYGNLKWENLDVYYQGGDGNPHTKDEVALMLGGFNRSGYDQSAFIQAENYNLDGLDSNIDFNDNYSGRGWFGNWWANQAGLDVNGDWGFFRMLTPFAKYFNKDTRNSSWNLNIADHPEDWASLVLDSIADNTNLTFLNRFNYSSDPASLAVIINRIIQENNMSLTPKQRNAYLMLLRRAKAQQSRQSVPSEKEGGILKAAAGDLLDVLERPSIASSVRKKYDKKAEEADKLALRAAERGVSDKVQAASERGWTASDSLRAAALVQDIAGTIAAVSGAFTGGAGSLAAEVTGFTSMGTDLVADLTDESVTTGEALKNAAINTGFALTSFIPGAKLGKIAKGVLKILPHAVTAIAAANVALSPEVHASVEKLMKSGAPGAGKLTTKDWQNVMIVLRTANGVGRSAAGIKNIRTNRQKLEKVQSEVNPNEVTVKIKDSEVRMTKAEADKIDAGLKKGATDAVKQEANEILARVKPGETIESISTKRNPTNWKERFTFRGDRVLDRVNPEVTTDPTKLTTALEAEDVAFQNKIQSSGWQRGMAAMDRAASYLRPGIQSGSTYSPFLLQAMRTYGTVGNEESGSTAKVREKLAVEAAAKAEAEARAAETARRSAEAASKPERAKLKLEEVKDVGYRVDKINKKITAKKAYRGNQAQAKRDAETLANLRDDLAELKGGTSDPEVLRQIGEAETKLKAAIDNFKLMEGAWAERVKSYGLKHGGLIISKYSHLRK